MGYFCLLWEGAGISPSKGAFFFCDSVCYIGETLHFCTSFNKFNLYFDISNQVFFIKG